MEPKFKFSGLGAGFLSSHVSVGDFHDCLLLGNFITLLLGFVYHSLVPVQSQLHNMSLHTVHFLIHMLTQSISMIAEITNAHISAYEPCP